MPTVLCPHCQQPMSPVGGIGSRREMICARMTCPNNVRHAKCPRCNSSEKSSVRAHGLGDREYTCAACSQVWTGR